MLTSFYYHVSFLQVILIKNTKNLTINEQNDIHSFHERFFYLLYTYTLELLTFFEAITTSGVKNTLL